MVCKTTSYVYKGIGLYQDQAIKTGADMGYIPHDNIHEFNTGKCPMQTQCG